MDDLPSDDSNGELANCKTLCSKKRQLDSSSSSDEDKHATPQKDQTSENNPNQNATSRSSERIKKQRSKSFTMPTKHDVWDAIPTTKTPEKTYGELKPRKLVNNFTRVTHRYNHDPAYTSDEGDSLDGFLDMGEGDSSTDTSDSDFYDGTLVEEDPRKKKKKHRIKKRRILQPSSDSESNSREPNTQASAADHDDDDVRARLREKLLNKRNSVDGSVSVDVNAATSSSKDEEGILSAGIKKAQAILASSSDDENVQKINMATSSRPRLHHRLNRKRKSRSKSHNSNERSDSGDANDESTNPEPDTCVPSVLRSKESRDDNSDNATAEKRSDGERSVSVEIISDDEASVDNNTSNSDSVQKARKRRRSALDSGSDSNTTSEEEDGGALSRSALQSKTQKEKRASLFKDFKQARSKLESKNQGK